MSEVALGKSPEVGKTRALDGPGGLVERAQGRWRKTGRGLLTADWTRELFEDVAFGRRPRARQAGLPWMKADMAPEWE